MNDNKLLWRLVGLDTALLIILMDQFSKWLMLVNVFGSAYKGLAPDILTWLFNKAPQLSHAPVKVVDIFNFVLVWNPGVSFGMLQGHFNYYLSLFAIFVAICFLVWMWREPRPTLALPVGLIAGGALGNVWDRLRFGAVIDFLDFHLGNWHWPAFNIADTAITIGVILLLIDQIFLAKSYGGKK